MQIGRRSFLKGMMLVAAVTAINPTKLIGMGLQSNHKHLIDYSMVPDEFKGHIKALTEILTEDSIIDGRFINNPFTFGWMYQCLVVKDSKPSLQLGCSMSMHSTSGHDYNAEEWSVIAAENVLSGMEKIYEESIGR